MSKGGGKGSSTTTIQKADPWVGVQPALSQLYGSAQNWYNSSNPQFYPGSTIAPTNWETEHALALGRDRATRGSPVLATANVQNQMTQNGAYLNSNYANPLFSQVASGALVGNNPGQAGLKSSSSNTGTFGKFSSGAYMGKNTANSYLLDAMAGKYVGQQNPYLGDLYRSASDPMVEQFQNSIAPSLASQFSMAGRMGSGSHLSAFEGAGNSLARGLGTLSSQLYGQAYENERGRQQQAAGIVSDNYNTERGMQLQGASGQFNAQQALANLHQQERAMQLQAGQALSNNFNFERGLQAGAQQFAPQLAASDYNDIEKLMNIGQYRQAYAQDLINADRERFDFGQSAPFNKLQGLNQLLQGGASYAGSTSTQNQSLARNPFASALGGAATANALGGAIGGSTGAMIGGPWGLLGGALLGGLFG